MPSIAIHTNPHLPNQIEFANYLAAGFKRHGLRSQITASINQDADIHVIQGPHYAKHHWLGHPRVLYLERGWWGDGAYDVALAWMDCYGALKITTGCPDDRPRPVLQPWKQRADNALYCIDFGMEPQDAVFKMLANISTTVRYHPRIKAPAESLVSAFNRHDFIIGYGTTTLVAACIAGLPVVCLDAKNPVWPVASGKVNQLNRPDRDGWLKNLSYHQWNGDEIAAGDAWLFLKDRM